MTCIGTLLCGTLVIMIPTREGFVAAAESRAGNEYRNNFCDEDFKLIEITPEPARSIATVTGLAGMRRPSNEPDFCRHLREATKWLDLKQTFKSYIESHKQTARTLSISGMVPALEEAFAAIPTEGRQILAPFAGRQLSLFVRASFEPDTWISWVRYARLVLSPDLKPTIAEEAVEQLGLENEMMFYRLGEKDYADQQMNRGALNRHFRSANTLPFLTTRKRIKEVTRDALVLL